MRLVGSLCFVRKTRRAQELNDLIVKSLPCKKNCVFLRNSAPRKHSDPIKRQAQSEPWRYCRRLITLSDYQHDAGAAAVRRRTLSDGCRRLPTRHHSAPGIRKVRTENIETRSTPATSQKKSNNNSRMNLL